ncbi:hypothetical protein CYMTET_50581 [Cymbomonas tetramitiformis]|uniref:Protein kinase domain-containing protein n=1 Tax=Cymbomonas tetramitiformis TaxID=36881 RepID=A0AAE0BNW6_9CHLO|nr:hypothetical protein CYMTET_50581 [Cymbomonas tetramitiformis]|eukprot:gene34258-biopygen22946
MQMVVHAPADADKEHASDHFSGAAEGEVLCNPCYSGKVDGDTHPVVAQLSDNTDNYRVEGGDVVAPGRLQGPTVGDTVSDQSDEGLEGYEVTKLLGISGAMMRVRSHTRGELIEMKAVSEPNRAAQLAAMVKLLQGLLEPLRGRYKIERDAGQRQGASGVVCFAVDSFNGTRVAIKLFLIPVDFLAEKANYGRCISPYIVKILDMHPPPPLCPEQKEGEAALLSHGHLVLERGMYSLQEFLQRRPKLNAVRKLNIMNDVFMALRFLHDDAQLVHGDIKPANLVKFEVEDMWKLIDLATANPIGEEAQLEYTLRYAPPELVHAARKGHRKATREPAVDMWSVGVIMYELYTGRRLFEENATDEEVVKQLLMPEELVLKGLAVCEAGAARLIRYKLLVKEPSERWSAEKVLSSSFFKRMDDTTKMSNSSLELARDVHRLTDVAEKTARLVAVGVAEMQAGSLMVEVQLTEISPKQQSCILSEHERVGPVFNLVPICHYQVEITIFRESAQLANPVKTLAGAVLHTTDGWPLPLELLPAPVDATARLPNGMTFVGTWAPATCQSALLVTNTKWPDTRQVTLELQLELHDLPGEPVTIQHELSFLVHTKDSMMLRAQRAYQWAKQEYLNLNPATRAAIHGVVFAVQTAIWTARTGMLMRQIS